MAASLLGIIGGLLILGLGVALLWRLEDIFEVGRRENRRLRESGKPWWFFFWRNQSDETYNRTLELSGPAWIIPALLLVLLGAGVAIANAVSLLV
jgi:hypothetical protein